MLVTGDGGNAGQVTLHFKRVKGNMLLKTCPGKGAAAATNGAGGAGKKSTGGSRRGKIGFVLLAMGKWDLYTKICNKQENCKFLLKFK